jgi:hypothetical protein
MALFAVIRDASAINNDALATTLLKRFPNNVYQVNTGQWIVAAQKNVHEFSLEIGISPGKPYSGTLILEIASYYGLHNKKLWEWMKERKNIGP